jgi:pyruvate formate lyase activating enzyme
MKEARLYESLPRHQARCQVCPRRCILPEGESGYCKTRVNQGGKVFFRIYGKVGSLALSPIEKKLVYHFYPDNPLLSPLSFISSAPDSG